MAPNTASVTILHFRQNFGERIISRSQNINWSPLSSNLTKASIFPKSKFEKIRLYQHILVSKAGKGQHSDRNKRTRARNTEICDEIFLRMTHSCGAEMDAT